jgi:class 3 adenylate cyclase/tetratricopeptide (TPR) repeat protein
MAGSRRERKVVTVLFADLVGFTSRAESMDPEDVAAILRPYHDHLRRELERYGGTVEKFIGDAVMAVFGAPLAHDDDPERAVRAALAIRGAYGEQAGLEMRIGINTGPALVVVDAHPEAGEGMVAGDVVNTAARLQGAAPANGVLVGEATYRATERAIEYESAPPVDAKGKSEPVRAWLAIQSRSRVELDARAPRTPLVGRERELDLLVGALARVREDLSPQLVTLIGEPGIGKSRLIRELYERIEADPDVIWWRHGRSLPYGDGVSVWALGEMVKSHAGILESDGPAVAEEKLRVAVEAMPDAAWLGEHLRPLVGLGGGADVASDRRAEAFVAWRRFFEALAEQRPLVLVFEDLHWADDVLLDFVDQLIDWSTGVPLLVVAAARPELLVRRPGWGGGKRNSTTISLTPLNDAQTASLIEHLLSRSALAPDVEKQLLARAGGNPLYAEEFALMFADRASASDVPESVQGVIAARLDSLPGDAKLTLQRAAVVGKVFWLGALEAMDGVAGSELEILLHSLERSEFVRRDRRTSVENDTQYQFAHVLLRDVAYEQIPRSDRGRLHLRAARWIEGLARREDAADMLAHHYTKALEYPHSGEEETTELNAGARRALTEAGDRAYALYSYETALGYYARALELWPRGAAERNRIQVQRAHAQFFVDPSRIDDMQRALEEVTASGDSVAAAEVAAAVGWSAWSRGERDRAIHTLRVAAAAIESAPAQRAKAEVLHGVARVMALGGDDEAVPAAEAALEVAREAGARDLEARSLNTLGVARTHAGDMAGIEDIRRSIELSESIPSPVDICRGYVNLSATVSNEGDLVEGYRLVRAGSEASQRWGMRPQMRWFRGEAGAYLYEFGRWDEALEAANEFIAEVEAGSPHYLEASVRYRRSLIWFARGRTEAALPEAARAVELAHRIGDPQLLLPVLGTSALIHVLSGSTVEAGTEFDQLLASVGGAHVDWASASPELAFAMAALGRSEELLTLLRRSASTARWVQAAIAFARHDFAVAAQTYSAIGSNTAAAYSLLMSPAGDDVRRALEFYRSVGATRFIEEAERRLSAGPRAETPHT